MSLTPFLRLFLNGGEPIHLVPAIPTWLSLLIIISILAITIVASLLKSRRAEGV